MREAFRRAIRKKKASKSGDPAPKIRKWKYEEEMSFLLPFYQERETLTNISIAGEESEVNDITEDDNISDHITQEAEQTTNVAVDENSANEERSTATNTATTSAARKIYSKNKKKVPVSASSVLMEYIIKNNSSQERDTIRREKDEVDKFFESMAATVKKLTPINIAVAKSKIFAIVSELEFEELHTTLSNTPTQQTNKNIPVQHTSSASTLTSARATTSHSFHSSPIESPFEDWENSPPNVINL